VFSLMSLTDRWQPTTPPCRGLCNYEPVKHLSYCLRLQKPKGEIVLGVSR